MTNKDAAVNLKAAKFLKVNNAHNLTQNVDLAEVSYETTKTNETDNKVEINTATDNPQQDVSIPKKDDVENFANEKSFVEESTTNDESHYQGYNTSELSKSVKKEQKSDEVTAEDKKTINGVALAALIFSILSLFLGYWGWLVCAIISTICYFIATKQLANNPDKYRGAKLLKWSTWIILISSIIWLTFILLI